VTVVGHVILRAELLAAATATETRLGRTIALIGVLPKPVPALLKNNAEPTLAAHVLYLSLCVLRGLLFKFSLFCSFASIMAIRHSYAVWLKLDSPAAEPGYFLNRIV
jgi:hypothetical protein